MTKLKTVFFQIIFYLGFTLSYGQVYKFKTSGYSVSEKDTSNKWGQWSDLKGVTILTVLDTNKNRIVIYSEVIQLFDIIDYLPEKENETDLVYTFFCKDNNGEDCTLSINTRKNQNNRKQLYVNYDDRIIVYNIDNF
jgi:hypothetical protein